MEHLSNAHKDRHDQHENSHKLYDKTGHPVMRIRVLGPSRKVNYLSKVVCDRKILTEFTRSISSTKIG